MDQHASAQSRDRPAAGEYPDFEHAYIVRVPAGPLPVVLERQRVGTIALLRTVPASRADYAYAPGKWTIKDVVGHVCDTERIMAYRALRFARGDTTPLPGFDQDAYVPAGEFGARTLNSLIHEFDAVRRASIALFSDLPADGWTRRGTANGFVHTARALAYVIAGHELHHRAILQTRYGVGAVEL
jgi:uncharacterized damage-inducible protein DinB